MLGICAPVKHCHLTLAPEGLLHSPSCGFLRCGMVLEALDLLEAFAELEGGGVAGIEAEGGDGVLEGLAGYIG